MKRSDLKSKMQELGLEVNNDLIDYIMAQNGADIELLKTNHSTEIQTLQEQLQAKESKVQELEANTSQYADYEELKKFKANAVAKEEENRKIEFLKGQGCKHPELFVGRFDFTKATYNEEKKTYEGLDESLKNARETYKDMFEVKSGSQIINPDSSQSSSQALSGVEKAFYQNNPDLMPRN